MSRNVRGITSLITVIVGTLSGWVGAQNPNYVQTTVYPQDRSITSGTGYVHAPVTSTEYSDGLGRSLQAQLRVDDTKSIITGTTYDALGRPEKATKPFPIDGSNSYYSSNVTDGADNYYSSVQLYAGQHAYTQTAYYDDPLGRVSATGAPGALFSLDNSHHPRFWYLGVTVPL